MQDLVGDTHFLTVLTSVCVVFTICASLVGCLWCRKKKDDKEQLLDDRVISLAPPISLVVHHPQPRKENVDDTLPDGDDRNKGFTAGNILQKGTMEYSSGVSFIPYQPQNQPSTPYCIGGMAPINEEMGKRLTSTSQMANSLLQALEPGKLDRRAAVHPLEEHDILKSADHGACDLSDIHKGSDITAGGNDDFSDVSLDGTTDSLHDEDKDNQGKSANKPTIHYKIQLKTSKKFFTLKVTIEGATDLPSAHRGYNAILYDANLLTPADENGIVDVIRPTRKLSSHEFAIENVFIFCFRDIDLRTSSLRMRVYRKNERKWRTKLVGELKVPCWNVEQMGADFLHSKVLKLVKHIVKSRKQQNGE